MFSALRFPLAAALVLLAGVAMAGDAERVAPDGSSVHDFLRRHWRRPIAAQGTPPARFSPLEASLAPQSCDVQAVARELTPIVKAIVDRAVAGR